MNAYLPCTYITLFNPYSNSITILTLEIRKLKQLKKIQSHNLSYMSIVVTLEFDLKQPDWRVNALKHCPTSLFCLKGFGTKELMILNY